MRCCICGAPALNQEQEVPGRWLCDDCEAPIRDSVSRTNSGRFPVLEFSKEGRIQSAVLSWVHVALDEINSSKVAELMLRFENA